MVKSVLSSILTCDRARKQALCNCLKTAMVAEEIQRAVANKWQANVVIVLEFQIMKDDAEETEQGIADLEEIIALYGTFNVDYKDLVVSAR